MDAYIALPHRQEEASRTSNTTFRYRGPINHIDRITTLDKHSGFVKGLTWDPVGKYMASQVLYAFYFSWVYLHGQFHLFRTCLLTPIRYLQIVG